MQYDMVYHVRMNITPQGDGNRNTDTLLSNSLTIS